MTTIRITRQQNTTEHDGLALITGHELDEAGNVHLVLSWQDNTGTGAEIVMTREAAMSLSDELCKLRAEAEKMGG